MTRDKAHLVRSIKAANIAYHVHNWPTISDRKFDQLTEELRKMDPANTALDFLGRRGRGVDKITHYSPMLSLDKVYSTEEMASWLAKHEGPFFVSPKYDGVAVSLLYDKGVLTGAATRGDGHVGKDVLAQVTRIPGIPHILHILHHIREQAVPPMIEIRGEVVMGHDAFYRHFSKYFTNSRNLTAGLLNRDSVFGDPEVLAKHLSFYPYYVDGIWTKLQEGPKLRRLETLGFSRIAHVHTYGAADVLSYIDGVLQDSEKRKDTDGIVVKLSRPTDQAATGVTAHHPKHSMAFKFPDRGGLTTLIDVGWDVSRTGLLTPVAVFEPIKLSGASLTRASLHNVSRMESLGLSEGCTIEVCRRGSVIPHVEGVDSSIPGAREFQTPLVCPSCAKRVRICVSEGTPPIRTLECTKGQCQGIQEAKLVYFCKTLRMQGFGPSVIHTLVQNSLVLEPADLWWDPCCTISGMKGFGGTIWKNLHTEVRTNHNTVQAAVLVEALGLPGVGKTTAVRLMEKFSDIPELHEADVVDIAAVPGVGQVTATAIFDSLIQMESMICNVLEKVEVIPHPSPAQHKTEGPLTGSSICFTGRLESGTRKQHEERAKEAGATIAGVTKTLTYLVVGNEGVSSKQKKASTLIDEGCNVTIITEEEFLGKTGKEVL